MGIFGGSSKMGMEALSGLELAHRSHPPMSKGEEHPRLSLDFRLWISQQDQKPGPLTTVLGRSWVELGTEHESLFQVLDENTHFRGQPAAGGPYGKDWYCSLKGGQKTDDGTLSEFCCEEPCRRLGNPKMFQDTHTHLFHIAGTKDSCGNNTLRVLSGAEAPRLCGAPLDKNDGSKAVEIFRRFRCAVAREILRRCNENGHGLRESSRDQSGIWKIP